MTRRAAQWRSPKWRFPWKKSN